MSDKIRVLYEFEDFRLDAASPCLWRGSELISIPPKALEMLTLLVTRKGEIVSREELIETVWKDTFVEEGNINYTISLLRKIFDNKDLIKTIPRHGYRFTAPVNEVAINPNATTPRTSNPKLLMQRTQPIRWVLISALIAGFLFVTSFAYFWRGGPMTKPVGATEVENADARAIYQRGKMILENRSVENREEKAMDEFQKAVALDPTLALAYAGLAEGFTSASIGQHGEKGRETLAKAKAAVEKALSLQPDLPEGLVIRGWMRKNFDWDWSGAESDLRRAIELMPNNAIAHQRLSHTLAVTGKLDEALAEITLANNLDPISEAILSSRVAILEARHEYDTGLQQSQEYLRQNKANNSAARAYATFLYHKQDFAQVIEVAEASLTKSPNKTPFAWLSLLAASYQKIGQPEKADAALKQLQRLSQTDSKALYSLTMIYAETGHLDEAFEALEKCFEMREERMVWLKIEPRFANLRNDPRFQNLLRKLNLS